MSFLRSSLTGTCISFALGGTVTTKTGNLLIVFYVSAAIFVATLIYVVSVLPESFPKEKRNALSLMRPEPSFQGPFTTPLLIFEPLRMLIPTRKLDGARNWRLVWCATHAFVFTVANAYASTAWLVLASSKYHLTPADVSTSIKLFRCKLILFTLDWFFPHGRRSQQHDHLDADCPASYPLFASVLQPKNQTSPSCGRRYKQRRRTGIGDLRSFGCTFGFRVMCHRGILLPERSRIHNNPDIDLL